MLGAEIVAARRPERLTQRPQTIGELRALSAICSIQLARQRFGDQEPYVEPLTSLRLRHLAQRPRVHRIRVAVTLGDVKREPLERGTPPSFGPTFARCRRGVLDPSCFY